MSRLHFNVLNPQKQIGEIWLKTSATYRGTPLRYRQTETEIFSSVGYRGPPLRSGWSKRTVPQQYGTIQLAFARRDIPKAEAQSKTTLYSLEVQRDLFLFRDRLFTRCSSPLAILLEAKDIRLVVAEKNLLPVMRKLTRITHWGERHCLERLTNHS